MTKVTRTIKLKFHNLNQVKQQLFAFMTAENTRLANKLLAMPYMERREVTTAKIITSLKSALANQTIRHTISATGRKVKHYKCLPPEINKQNWKLEKRGDTYSLSFPTIQGVRRVPIVVASKHWEPMKGASLSWKRGERQRQAYLSPSSLVCLYVCDCGCSRGTDTKKSWS